jgi:hypothetical protein
MNISFRKYILSTRGTVLRALTLSKSDPNHLAWIVAGDQAQAAQSGHGNDEFLAISWQNY